MFVKNPLTPTPTHQILYATLLLCAVIDVENLQRLNI